MISYPFVCLGQPLLDICATVSLDLFENYGIIIGSTSWAEEKHLPLYKELIENYQCDFIAGGASQNACRAAQWMSKTPNFSTFFGCVGEDEISIRLREAAAKAGVAVHYQVDSTLSTGICAVLIYNKERSLLTNPSASKNLTLEYAQSNWSVFEQAQVIYTEGYLFVTAVELVVESGKYACENGKIFAVNISAQFIVELFKDYLMRALPYCEYLFGNEDETQKFGEVFGFGNDIIEIVKQMSNMPSNTPRPKKIVITRGKDPVIIAIQGEVTEYPVPFIEQEKILDLNGAGDSFVGAFLYHLIKGSSLEKCVAAGNYLSGEVIQLSGCSLPATSTFPE